MGRNKPRTAVGRVVNQKLAENGTECEWWDGGYPECMLNWAHKGDKGCNGNPFVCRKLYYQHLASLSDAEKAKIGELFLHKFN